MNIPPYIPMPALPVYFDGRQTYGGSTDGYLDYLRTTVNQMQDMIYSVPPAPAGHNPNLDFYTQGIAPTMHDAATNYNEVMGAPPGHQQDPHAMSMEPPSTRDDSLGGWLRDIVGGATLFGVGFGVASGGILSVPAAIVGGILGFGKHLLFG